MDNLTIKTVEDARLFLGLLGPYSEQDLQERYRFLVKAYHPDTSPLSCNTVDAFNATQLAYNILRGKIPVVKTRRYRHGKSILDVELSEA